MHPLIRTFSALLLSSIAAGPVLAADHREAPAVDEKPPADLNDIYVFQGAGGGRIVLAMTVNPAADPDFAASFNFSPDVLYRFEVSTRGDAAPEHVVDATFGPFVPGQPQTFRVALDGRSLVEGTATIPTVLVRDPPPPTIVRQNGVTAFAGPRDDPFFFDAIGFQRVLKGTGKFRGVDTFADNNVSAIVLELPARLVSDGQRRIEVSGITYVKAGAVISPKGTPKVGLGGETYEQFDRTGQPAVNTAFIPGPLKDEFNRTRPENDPRRFGDVIRASLTQLGTPQGNADILLSLVVPDTIKYDLRAPDGFPNGRRLQDDVIDAELTLVFGKPTSDGVDSNDRPFLREFPYMGPPQTAKEKPGGRQG